MNELCDGCNKQVNGKCTAYSEEGVALHLSRGYCVCGRQHLDGYYESVFGHKQTRKIRAGQGKTNQGGNL